MHNILSMKLCTAGLQSDLLNDLLCGKLEISATDLRVNDESRQRRQLRDTNLALRRIDNTDPNVPILIRPTQ